jgi:hypothetical protein
MFSGGEVLTNQSIESLHTVDHMRVGTCNPGYTTNAGNRLARSLLISSTVKQVKDRGDGFSFKSPGTKSRTVFHSLVELRFRLVILDSEPYVAARIRVCVIGC